jgi:hypothetical protein
MSEKSLRAKAIPVLRLSVSAVLPCGGRLGTARVGKSARLTRNEATRCTMPTAWQLKMDIPANSDQSSERRRKDFSRRVRVPITNSPRHAKA